MHSHTADYVPDAATCQLDNTSDVQLVSLPGEVGETYERVVFDSGQFAALCENMTSATNAEVHCILHYRQRRTEPRPQVTCTGNFVTFGRVFLTYATRHTDR